MFIRSNPKGIIYERWRHIHGCARFFNAVRDTVSDKFVMTYKAGEPKPELAVAANENAAMSKAGHRNEKPRSSCPPLSVRMPDIAGAPSQCGGRSGASGSLAQSPTRSRMATLQRQPPISPCGEMSDRTEGGASAPTSDCEVALMTAANRIPGAGRLAGNARRASPSTASPITGLEGDTLASALIANGVHLVGRSFKYHRPRGILSAGAEEPNALVTDRARRGAQDAERARHRAGAL